jgi:hypothetical protein
MNLMMSIKSARTARSSWLNWSNHCSRSSLLKARAGLRRDLLTISISRTGFKLSAPSRTAIAIVPEMMLFHVRAVATPTSSLMPTMVLLTSGVVDSKNRTSPMRGRLV